MVNSQWGYLPWQIYSHGLVVVVMVSYYDYYLVIWHVVPMVLSSETKVFRSIGKLKKLLFG